MKGGIALIIFGLCVLTLFGVIPWMISHDVGGDIIFMVGFSLIPVGFSGIMVYFGIKRVRRHLRHEGEE